MGGILNYQKTVSPGQLHHGIHIAGNAGIMNHHNGPGTAADQAFDQADIHIWIVWIAVGKNDMGPAEDKGIGRGNKGKGGHNHLVAGLDAGQKGGHFEGIGAGGGEQHLSEAVALAKKIVAFSRKLSVSRNFALCAGGGNMVGFAAGKMGFVERKLHHR